MLRRVSWVSAEGAPKQRTLTLVKEETTPRKSIRARVDRHRLVPVLLLLVLALVGAAGCEGFVEDIGSGDGSGAGRAPADLSTSKAERAAWPDAPKDAVRAEVQRVSDGDTFVAMVRGRKERIRVIGVDTPESVSPNQPDEPFGEEASDFAKHYLDGETVRLAGDAEPRDRYGRMLAYVWLEDGTFWNALLAAEGYAQQLTIPPNVTYERLFRRLVAEARREDRGLWAEETQASP
jgi:endonuclease YncB( thermonuclease family)